jgi:hypothetical protein
MRADRDDSEAWECQTEVAIASTSSIPHRLRIAPIASARANQVLARALQMLISSEVIFCSVRGRIGRPAYAYRAARLRAGRASRPS